MKNDKNKDKTKISTPRARHAARLPERDWGPLLVRLRDAIDWALDIAKNLAREIHEDVDAIERTRSYAHAWIDARPVDIDMNDVLVTLGVLFAAAEIDLGIDSAPVLEALAVCQRMLHLPGAWHDATPTVVIRTPLRRRNAASFTHLVA